MRPSALILIACTLIAVGIGHSVYRHIEQGVPLLPGGSETFWDVEARGRLEAEGLQLLYYRAQSRATEGAAEGPPVRNEPEAPASTETVASSRPPLQIAANELLESAYAAEAGRCLSGRGGCARRVWSV